jgi:hypothetical protein
MIGQFVLVRTFSAGVHMGELVEFAGTAVTLRDARRLRFWRQAFTLSEASQHGVAESSQISEPVPLILLTQAIEVIPCSKKAVKNLSHSRNGTPSVK